MVKSNNDLFKLFNVKPLLPDPYGINKIMNSVSLHSICWRKHRFLEKNLRVVLKSYFAINSSMPILVSRNLAHIYIQKFLICQTLFFMQTCFSKNIFW